MTQSPDRARQVAEEVLSRPAYREHEPGLLDRVRQQVLQWLADIVQSFLEAGGASVVAWAIVAIGLVAVVLLAWRFSRTVERDQSGGLDTTRTHRESRNWAREAAAHEAAGRWRQAVRCRFRELVAALDDRGWLEEGDDRTVGEHRSALFDARRDLVAPFDEAGAVFEQVWYGHRPADADDPAAIRRASERLLTADSGR